MPVAVTTSDAALSPVKGANRTAEAKAGRAAHVLHSVLFYEHTDFLRTAVADFLSAGLAAGERVAVIATAEHRAGFEAELRDRGFDIDRAAESGQLTSLDARELLASFMDGSVLDVHRFREYVGGLVGRMAGDGDTIRFRAYGEMVQLLWRDGKKQAAIQLEELWNGLLNQYPFHLLCAYRMDGFGASSDAKEFGAICGCHGHVVPSESYTLSADEDERAREVCRLQQRSRALEEEIERREALENALRNTLAEYRRAEEALRHAQESAERVKSEFLAVVSHELRTPLNTIMGYQNLLAQGVSGPVTPMQERHLARIDRAAQELARLIDQMISRSSIEAGRHELSSELVDVRAIGDEASELAEPSAAENGLSLTFRGPAEPVFAATDAGKLKQILLSLLSNAIKFTSQGSVELSLAREMDRLIFAVRDTGIGIDAEDLDRIFRPFVQVDASTSRQHGGIGLGLSLGRDLARLLGGDITVESSPGEGSTFTLWLPAVQAASHYSA